MDRKMWVFILLLVIGGTIIVMRTFRNGAREALSEPAERGTFTPATSPSVPKARQPARAAPAISPTTAARSRGACLSCGTEIAPGAKFCGECGHRLVN